MREPEAVDPGRGWRRCGDACGEPHGDGAYRPSSAATATGSAGTTVGWPAPAIAHSGSFSRGP